MPLNRSIAILAASSLLLAAPIAGAVPSAAMALDDLSAFAQPTSFPDEGDSPANEEPEGLRTIPSGTADGMRLLSFDGNSPDASGTGIEPVMVSYDTPYQLPEPTTAQIARPGYSFVQWNTEPDGSGTSYEAGSTILPSRDTVLYAQWEESFLTSFTGAKASISIAVLAFIVLGIYVCFRRLYHSHERLEFLQEQDGE